MKNDRRGESQKVDEAVKRERTPALGALRDSMGSIGNRQGSSKVIHNILDLLHSVHLLKSRF